MIVVLVSEKYSNDDDWTIFNSHILVLAAGRRQEKKHCAIDARCKGCPLKDRFAAERGNETG